MSLLIEAQLTEQSKPSVCSGVFRLAVALSMTLVVGCAASGPSAPGEATVTVFAQGGLLHGSKRRHLRAGWEPLHRQRLEFHGAGS